jgi:hypothetical protein
VKPDSIYSIKMSSCIGTPVQLTQITNQELEDFRNGGSDTPTTYTFCAGTVLLPAQPSSKDGFPSNYNDDAYVGSTGIDGTPPKPLVILNANRRIECPGGGCIIRGALYLFMAPRSVSGVDDRVPDVSGLVIDGMQFSDVKNERPVSVFAGGDVTFANCKFSNLGFETAVHVEGDSNRDLSVTFRKNSFEFNEINTGLNNAGLIFASRVNLFVIENKFISNEVVSTGGRMIIFEGASTSETSGYLYANCFAGNVQNKPGLVRISSFEGLPFDFLIDQNFESLTVIENPIDEDYDWQVGIMEGDITRGKFSETECKVGLAPPVPTSPPTLAPTSAPTTASGGANGTPISVILLAMIMLITWMRA